MLRIARLLPTLLALTCAANAWAGGRAACRVELPLDVLCYGEQVLFSAGPLELGGGAEYGYDPATEAKSAFTPYAYAAWYAPDWFTVVEVRSPVVFPELTPSVGFALALTFGIRW